METKPQEIVVLPAKREYNKLVLFNHKPGSTEPFEIFNRDNFTDSEIRPEWYRFQMTPKSRIKKLIALKTYPQEVWSVFAKIQSSE